MRKKGIYSAIALLALIVVFTLSASMIKTQTTVMQNNTAYTMLSWGVAKTSMVRYYCETSAKTNTGPGSDANACCSRLNGTLTGLTCETECVIDFNSADLPFEIDYNCAGVITELVVLP